MVIPEKSDSLSCQLAVCRLLEVLNLARRIMYNVDWGLIAAPHSSSAISGASPESVGALFFSIVLVHRLYNVTHVHTPDYASDWTPLKFYGAHWKAPQLSLVTSLVAFLVISSCPFVQASLI